MSSTGGGTMVAGAPQLYFCYQCNRTVSITPPSPNADLLCPTCNGGFLEEFETPASADPVIPPPRTTNFESFSPYSDFFNSMPLLFSSSSSSSAAGADLQNPRNFSDLFEPFAQQSRSFPHHQDPDPFDPFAFLQNYLSSLRTGGANIQFVIENHHPSSGMGGFRLPANLGDYFVGPGLEQLIQQLAENDPNRYGTPPASKSAVEGLPIIVVDDHLLSSDLAQCAVCKDDFSKGMEVKQMPCKHVYHSDCIMPWLEMHNSCPVCRYELPTDDPDYENNRARGGSGGNSSAGGGGGGGRPLEIPPMDNRTVERRFRISLPWPLGALGFPAESSDGGAGGAGNNSGNNGGGGGGGSNSGGEGRRDMD